MGVHIVCKTCMEGLRNWSKDVKKYFSFQILMVWHIDDCYWTIILKATTTRIKKKFLSKIAFSLETGTQCWQHSCCSTKGHYGLYDRKGVKLRWWWCWYRQLCSTESRYCSNFLSGRAKCSNSRRRLAKLKISTELLGSCLKSKNWLTCGMSFSWYRNREEEFTCCFQRSIPLHFPQLFLD